VVIISDWVTILREAALPQVTGRLTCTNGNCCLGVLMEMAVAQGIIPEGEKGDYPDSPIYYEDEGKKVMGGLSTVVQKWSGMDSSSPQALGVDLITMNDTRRQKFPEIADAIEKEYLL